LQKIRFYLLVGNSQYSPPNTLSYYSAIETEPNIGQIAIGRDVTTNGGIISSHDTTYAKIYYNFINPSYTGTFDIIVDAKLSFDGVRRVNYVMSTSASENSVFRINRCDVNPAYDPFYWRFNVERGDSTFDQDEATRYSLYTQIVGVPYNITIASYNKGTSGKYNNPDNFTGTVELELLDASTFENNSSTGYDSVCRDSSNAIGEGKLFTFNNQSRIQHISRCSRFFQSNENGTRR